MIARIRKSLEKKDQGFTLIELLVVMIIIGILAAVAIPVFLSQRKKAQDTSAKADVSTLGKEIATWYVDNTGDPYVAQVGTEYFLGDAAPGETIGNSSSNVVLVTSAVNPNSPFYSAALHSSTNWCVYVTNIEGDKADPAGTVGGYSYSAANGLAEGPCTQDL